MHIKKSPMRQRLRGIDFHSGSSWLPYHPNPPTKTPNPQFDTIRPYHSHIPPPRQTSQNKYHSAWLPQVQKNRYKSCCRTVGREINHPSKPKKRQHQAIHKITSSYMGFIIKSACCMRKFKYPPLKCIQYAYCITYPKREPYFCNQRYLLQGKHHCWNIHPSIRCEHIQAYPLLLWKLVCFFCGVLPRFS